jgi:MFS family permease
MEYLGGEAIQQRPSIRQVAFASFIGTVVEWYDFFLYGTASALIFPKLFFPRFSPLAGTLASYATFGVAFFARPLGGIVFGHFGDRVGRKSMLVITLLIMGGATFLIGFLPTFEHAGGLAPTLLVVLRFLQGFAVGGEWGGATLMVVENAPEENRNFYSSWPQAGVPVGLVLSTAVFTAFSSLKDEEFFTWGWRVPFLLSIVLIAVGLFIRMRVLESPAFSRVKELGAESKVPLFDVLRHYPVAAILAIGVVFANIGGYYIVTIFTLTYITGRFGLARYVVLIGQMVAGAAEFAGILILARVADRVGKRPVAVWSAACMLLFSYPFFWLVNTGRPMLIWLAMSSWVFACGALYGVTGVFIAEFFKARVRYSGMSFGYQMAGMISGAPAAIVATALVHWAGGASWPVATYLAANCLITFLSVYLASEKYKVGINDQEPTDRLLAGNRGWEMD